MERDRTPRRPTPDEFMAIEPSALERAFSLFELNEDDPPVAEVTGGVSVVEISGPLGTKAEWIWDGYGGPHGIIDRFRQAMADTKSDAVMLHVNSPGGAVNGLFEAIDSMRAMTTKPVVAYCEGAYSAACALAMVADTIHVSRTGGVGSIGVIATAVSFAEQLAKDGVAVAVVASGAQKTDLHPALPLSEAAVKRLRVRVNELAEIFADEVASTRSLTAEQVLAQQASVFYGQAAVDAGLADRVSTFSAALEAARSMATERAHAAQKVKAMSIVTEALGLAENAIEAEIAARVGALRDAESALCAATGEASVTKALSRVNEWKREAAETPALRERAESAEGQQRAAYVTAVLTGKGIIDEPTKRLYERAAKDDFEAFQAEFPRPSDQELAARAGDSKRFARLPGAPKSPPTEIVDAAEPTEADLKATGLTREQYRTNERASRPRAYREV